MYAQRAAILVFGTTISALAIIAPLVAQERSSMENLGAGGAVLEGDWLAYSEWESFRGEDLNGDGDLYDSVLHVRNLASGSTRNLRLATLPVSEVRSLSVEPPLA